MIRYFAGHPTAANLVMIAFLVVGALSVPSIKRETFPDIPSRNVEVLVVYPGASAEEAEEAICQRIEDAVENVQGILETRCDARENRATATLEMVEGGNLDLFFSDIKTEVEAIDGFPDEVEDPVVRQLGRTDFVAAVAVTGPMAPTDLKAYAERLKGELLLTGAVSRVDIKGFSDRQIRIEIPAQTLRQYGISVDDIAAAVARQSVDLPAGTIETSDTDVTVRFADERRNPLEFDRLIIVGAETGGEVRLGDIATITDRFELAENKVVFNGKRAAVLEIIKTKTQDTLDVVDTVYAFVEEKRRTAPPGVSFEVTRDIASIVRDRLSMLVNNGAAGLVLVALTLLLFFNWRFSFWVTAALPVSFAGAFVVMAAAGMSFNMITMVALLIGIGILVDDAIVISENIAAHVRRGSPPLKAAVEGTRQVAPGVIASFATTICVFGSLAFLQGDIGSILKWMPIILILVLTISLFEAFLVLPHHIKGALSHVSPRPNPLRVRLESGIEWMRDVVVHRIVTVAIGWRYLTLGLALMALLGSMSLLAGGVIKFKPFPDIEGNVVVARLLMPQGTPLSRTTMLVDRLSGALQEVNREFAPDQPDGRNLVRNINIQFNRNIDAFESGPHIATVTGDLLGTGIRNTPVDTVLNRWRELAGTPADVIGLKFTEPAIGPAGRPIDVRLSGEDLDELKAASVALIAWLKGYDGVTDLTDDLRPGKPEVRVRLREGATALGLSARTVATQLRSAFHGRTANEIQVGTEAYEIDVRLAPGDKDSLGDLEYFTVTLPGGQQAPLGAVAVLEQGRGFARIHRIDRKRTVSVQGEVDTARANTAEVVADLQARFLPGFRERFPGVNVTFEGEAAEGDTTGASILRGFILGLIGVFILLSFMFRNYLEPIIVMATIPLGLIGVVWGHMLLGLNMSMPSIMGFASLAGVVVNNAILIVEFTKIERREGRDPSTAALNAAKRRFRAILLTSLTTVFGLLPLLTETSLQAQVLIPLVTSLTFGLATTTILMLFVVPALYMVLDDLGWTASVETEGEDELPAAAQPAE